MHKKDQDSNKKIGKNKCVFLFKKYQKVVDLQAQNASWIQACRSAQVGQ